LVKELIDLQNGEISVESMLEVGTTFVVMLPVADASIAARYSDAPPALVEVDLMDYEPDTQGEVASHQENKLELLIVSS